MTLMLVWLVFFLCAACIGVAGSALSRYGDVIADKTGISGNWVGLILLATVTSLPELVTGISSLTLANVPNIAVGDVFGSCVFNLALLIVLDFLHRGESVYRRASQNHILAAGFSVVLIGFAGVNILLANRTGAFHIAHVGAYTPVILLLYMLSMRTVYVYERAQVREHVEQVEERYPGLTLQQAVLRYALAAAVVVVAGAALPFVGAELAELMGWHKTFVGTLFVAAATSLPELAVTVAALRIGALDMAIANLLGSNLFNMAILALDDLIFLKGPLLSHISPIHAVSAMSAVVMSGVFIIGLVYRPSTRLFQGVGWVSLSLLTFYLLNSYVLFLYGE